ncbi:putative membrane protein, partial [Escherichia coli p0305293.13]
MISSGVIVVLFSFLIISFTEGTIKLILLSGGL